MKIHENTWAQWAQGRDPRPGPGPGPGPGRTRAREDQGQGWDQDLGRDRAGRDWAYKPEDPRMPDFMSSSASKTGMLFLDSRGKKKTSNWYQRLLFSQTCVVLSLLTGCPVRF